MTVISAKNVTKSFGASNALSDLSFTVKCGECFGMLGPNGAGKSTMIKLIYGVTHRTSGELTVLDFDPSLDSGKLRQNIGVVLQEDALDEAMSVRENMLMFSQFQGLSRRSAKERVAQLLEFMGLSAKADARIVTLSGGMKRRLAFVRSLLSAPKLLILDEPTTGLDPAVRQLIWQKILELKHLGTTILLTTHYMDEAEVLCDRIIVIDQGRKQADGTPKDLIATHCPGFVALVENKGQHARFEGATLEEITGLVKSQEQKLAMVRPANLEDVFLKLTSRNLNV